MDLVKHGYNSAEMRGAMQRDQALAKERGDIRPFGKSGRLSMQVDISALMNAVNTEGRDVIHDKGYWEDMKRRHPWTNATPDKGRAERQIATKTQRHKGVKVRNRFGVASFRKVYA